MDPADETYNGRPLDEAFIAAGFVGIKAEIDLLDTAFGSESYRAFLAGTSSEHGRNAFVGKSDALREEFLSSRQSPDGANRVIEKLISDPTIPGQSKHEFLRRFAPQRAIEILSPLMPGYYSTVRQETSLICKIHREPCLPLLERTTMKTRKTLYNEISLDAFHGLSFQAKKMTRGLMALAKQLDPANTIEVAVDHHPIEQHHHTSNAADITAYWRKLPLYMRMTLIHGSRREGATRIPLGVRLNAIATTRMMGFDCSCSLEVAIRAHAFLYEGIFLPFEEIAMTHKPPH